MTARNERLRERQKALGLEPVQTVLHPDDKAALLEYAYQLRVKRGTLTPTDIKRVNDDLPIQNTPAPTDSKILAAAIDDLPAPAPIPTDSQILEALPVQTESIEPTTAQSKINSVAAVVARFEAAHYAAVSNSKDGKLARWDQAIKLLRELKEKLS
jgi:hypothetical protein